jgi:ribosome-binding ATPase YchF (GTP1/OBG family)
VSAQIESDLIDLADEEANSFLKELESMRAEWAVDPCDLSSSWLSNVFHAGEKEVRAWTIHIGDTAPKAAVSFHSDFERGFIKAETVAYQDLVECGSIAVAR